MGKFLIMVMFLLPSLAFGVTNPAYMPELWIGKKVNFTLIASPSTPAVGQLTLYAKADKNLYTKDSDGVETVIGGVPGGSGALAATGTQAAPQTVTAAGGITPTSDQRQVWFVQSAGGAVSVTANPSIVAGSTVGQELMLSGTSATNYVIFSDGNGLSLNGPISLNNNSGISLIWNGLVWTEISRR